MRRVLLIGVLALGSLAGAAEVNVRFGNLAWVYARSGLPFVDARGKLVAPVQESCALLGVTCTVNAAGGTVDVNGAAVPLAPGRAGFVELRPLARAAGAAVSWDSATRMATLTANWRSGGVTDALSTLELAPGPARPPRRLEVNVAAADGPYRTLTLTSPNAGLTALTLVSKLTTGALNVTGDVRSSPDVRNERPACATGGTSCEALVDQTALYALADVR